MKLAKLGRSISLSNEAPAPTNKPLTRIGSDSVVEKLPARALLSFRNGNQGSSARALSGIGTVTSSLPLQRLQLVSRRRLIMLSPQNRVVPVLSASNCLTFLRAVTSL